MDTAQIRNTIQKAVEDESKTGRLADIVRQVSQQNGTSPTSEQVQQVVTFVREYVEHVPLLMEQGMAAAREVGLAAEMERMMAELQVYWREENDLIADRTGLVGLMDDAYASLFLLQAVSDYCQRTAGRPILAQNMTAANQLMQRLVGPPVAPQIEMRVGITIGQAMFQRMLMQLGSVPMFNVGNVPDPIWGNASIDEIVNARMGAMGFV